MGTSVQKRGWMSQQTADESPMIDVLRVLNKKKGASSHVCCRLCLHTGPLELTFQGFVLEITALLRLLVLLQGRSTR
jgi:hypothetical protein